MGEIPFSLSGKYALVTGGASGIGAATCRELAGAGAHVYIADLNLERAQQLAREAGPNATALHLDVTSTASIEAAVKQVATLDILVNCAGIGHVGNIEHTELEDFEQLMKVNVTAVYLVTRAFLSLLLKDRGSIVNIGSVAGQVGIKHRFAYSTSKGAIIAMTRQLAADYPKQLRVNCIAPGTVDTPFVESYLEKYHAHEKEKVRAEVTARQPMGRLGKPEEIASLVRYLCSPEADFFNGSIVTIDGGLTAV
ncbi:SDR family NAD(P)-dependent oxidoreductase [Acidipila rosea]|uniref:NAD(P)-dependent dehydrogenase (Short-subunit alcohol dehydrogenase family) n=1 Tax=Acidipila rosea TaxID=768535 RepID=A0A4R1LB77_9BACT|nr:SDR family oxidoreductase [Acidipila rosea]MBW4043861.1 SDR family oxidoreductase [Acidobacteriota bacterium]TCK74163.1 NAD(P)-dependent dehydrogenase (short-subunit alcohol dehydrogenase family) [Acidipila rosea]